jgi:hypothetical protein
LTGTSAAKRAQHGGRVHEIGTRTDDVKDVHGT